MTDDKKNDPGKNRMEHNSQVLFYRRHGHGGDKHDRDLRDFYEKEQKKDILGNPIENIRNLIILIDKISIDEQHKSDPDQQELLKRKKDQAKRLILDVLRKIGEYLSVIARMGSLKASADEYQPHDFRKRHEDVDHLRKINHEALISNINIANRFIVRNFGKADKELIEKWKNEEISAKRPVLYAERVELPKNIICPDQINLNDRNQVRRWAEQMGSYLSELKNEL